MQPAAPYIIGCAILVDDCPAHPPSHRDDVKDADNRVLLFWLGEDELGLCTGSTDADGIEEFAVRLEAGDTPLLCRLSAAEGDWALELHVEERLSAADFVVQAVPAVALRQVEALAPPAREMRNAPASRRRPPDRRVEN